MIKNIFTLLKFHLISVTPLLPEIRPEEANQLTAKHGDLNSGLPKPNQLSGEGFDPETLVRKPLDNCTTHPSSKRAEDSPGFLKLHVVIRYVQGCK